MPLTPAQLNLPARILLGAGPASVDPRVLAAMSRPLLGHRDPAFLSIMEEVQEMLRRVFRTSNRFTFPISGTGSLGMEAAIGNVVEPGDPVVVCVAGYFGARMADMVRRAGANLIPVEAPWGTSVPAERVEQAIRSARGPVKAVAVVHAETSTGVLQPMDDIVRIAHASGALVIVDAVTSLGAIPLDIDGEGATGGEGIDVCFAATQKCLGAPPGMAPLTAGPRALEKIRSRRAPPVSFNLDLLLLDKYWGPEHAYHHTAPVAAVYALREALRLALEEGLEARAERHRRVSKQLKAGIEGLGLEFLVKEPERLPVLTALLIPEGIDDAMVRGRLLAEHNIEIGGGLGPFTGKVWRIGLMGYSAREENVARLLTALRIILGAPRMSRPARRA